MSGPLLTASLWDPGHADDLADRVAALTQRAAVPVSSAPGDIAGCRHLSVRTGELGLGLPEDSAQDWSRVGSVLGDLVVAVRPALALVAPEWAAEGMLDPDPGLLGPGLTCGWVQVGGMAGARRERFGQLVERGVLRPLGQGWTWAAQGTVSLDGEVAGIAAEVGEQVFWAWTGSTPAESVTTPRVRLGVDAEVTEDEVGASLPAGYEVLGVVAGSAVARPPAWATAPAADLADSAVLLDATWAGVEDVVAAGPRRPVLLWVSSSRPDLVEEVAALAPAAGRSRDDTGETFTLDASSGDAGRAALDLLDATTAPRGSDRDGAGER